MVMNNDDPSLRDLMERVRIRETLERYFYGVDERKPDAVEACFTPDAVAIYHAGTAQERRLHGQAAIAQDVDRSCAALTASTHSVSNCSITVLGCAASACTFATSSIVHQDRVLVRGLRYHDTFSKNEDGWKIASRIHEPLWQFEQSSEMPRFI